MQNFGWSICFTLMLIGGGASAQKALFYQKTKTLSFGPRAGFTTSMISVSPSSLTPTIRISFMGGAFARYQLSDRFSIQLQSDLVPRGGGFNDNADSYKLLYVDVPVTLAYQVRYQMFKMPFTFDVFAGAQPSFLLGAKLGNTDVSNDFDNVGADLVIGSGFPMWRFLFYTTTKISLNNIASNRASFYRSVLTEWTMSYRLGSENAANNPEQLVESFH